MFTIRALRPLVIFLIGALLLSGVAPAHATQQQRAATALREHTATQLLDGRVLVAGGDDASTRFYQIGAADAQTGPPLSTPRRRHTATLAARRRRCWCSAVWMRGTPPLPAASGSTRLPTSGAP
jgi:hypothetical protein